MKIHMRSLPNLCRQCQSCHIPVQRWNRQLNVVKNKVWNKLMPDVIELILTICSDLRQLKLNLSPCRYDSEGRLSKDKQFRAYCCTCGVHSFMFSTEICQFGNPGNSDFCGPLKSERQGFPVLLCSTASVWGALVFSHRLGNAQKHLGKQVSKRPCTSYS